MRNQPVIWSAATCDFPRAGVYLGLAQEYEHLTVARALNPHQMRMYVGGQIHVETEPAPWPLVYYAVRDPSAVRVEPLSHPPTHRGFRHVHLHFRFDAVRRRSVVIATILGLAATPPSGFLVSVGLSLEHEETFYEQTIGHHPDQDWNALFERLRGAGKDIQKPGSRSGRLET